MVVYHFYAKSSNNDISKNVLNIDVNKLKKLIEYH